MPSYYGLNAYGLGRYSRRSVPVGALHILETSYTGFLGGYVERTRAMAALITASEAVFRGTKMWEKFDIPACEPWEFIAGPSCYLALGNRAGSMFPSAATPP